MSMLKALACSRLSLVATENLQQVIKHLCFFSLSNENKFEWSNTQSWFWNSLRHLSKCVVRKWQEKNIIFVDNRLFSFQRGLFRNNKYKSNLAKQIRMCYAFISGFPMGPFGQTLVPGWQAFGWGEGLWEGYDKKVNIILFILVVWFSQFLF